MWSAIGIQLVVVVTNTFPFWHHHVEHEYRTDGVVVVVVVTATVVVWWWHSQVLQKADRVQDQVCFADAVQSIPTLWWDLWPTPSVGASRLVFSLTMFQHSSKV